MIAAATSTQTNYTRGGGRTPVRRTAEKEEEGAAAASANEAHTRFYLSFAFLSVSDGGKH